MRLQPEPLLPHLAEARSLGAERGGADVTCLGLRPRESRSAYTAGDALPAQAAALVRVLDLEGAAGRVSIDAALDTYAPPRLRVRLHRSSYLLCHGPGRLRAAGPYLLETAL